MTGGGAGEAPPSAGGGQHICLVIKDLDVGKGGAERLFVELAAILAGLGYKGIELLADVPVPVAR